MRIPVVAVAVCVSGLVLTGCGGAGTQGPAGSTRTNDPSTSTATTAPSSTSPASSTSPTPATATATNEGADSAIRGYNFANSPWRIPGGGSVHLTNGKGSGRGDWGDAAKYALGTPALGMKWEPKVYGDLNGDKVEDAVVTIAKNPGTPKQELIPIAWLGNSAGNPNVIGPDFLQRQTRCGDQISSIAIENQQIVIRGLLKGATCDAKPSKPFVRTYKVNGHVIDQTSGPATEN